MKSAEMGWMGGTCGPRFASLLVLLAGKVGIMWSTVSRS